MFRKSFVLVELICLGIAGSALCQGTPKGEPQKREVPHDFELRYDRATRATRLYRADGTEVPQPVVLPSGKMVRYIAINANPFLVSITGKNEHKPPAVAVPDTFKGLIEAATIPGAEVGAKPGDKSHANKVAKDAAAIKDGLGRPIADFVKAAPASPIHSQVHEWLKRGIDPMAVEPIVRIAKEVNTLPGNKRADSGAILAALKRLYEELATFESNRETELGELEKLIEPVRTAITDRKTALRDLGKSETLFQELHTASRSNPTEQQMMAEAENAIGRFGGNGNSWVAIRNQQELRITTFGSSSGAAKTAIDKARKKIDEASETARARSVGADEAAVALSNVRNNLRLNQPDSEALLEISTEVELQLWQARGWRRHGESLRNIESVLATLETENKKLDESSKEIIAKSNKAAGSSIALFREISNSSFEVVLSENTNTKEGKVIYQITGKDIGEDGKLTDWAEQPQPFEFDVVDSRHRRPFYGAGYLLLDNLGNHRQYEARSVELKGGGTELQIAERRRESLSSSTALFVHFPMNPRARGDIDAWTFGIGLDSYLVGYSRAFGSSTGSIATIGLGLRPFERLDNGLRVGQPISEESDIRTKKVYFPVAYISLQFRFGG